MNELPRVSELDPLAEYQRTHVTAHRVGIEALEQELAPTTMVDISLYVMGRTINTTTDSATVARIMALLTGLGG